MMVRYTARQAPLRPEVKSYCDKRLKSLDKLMRRVLTVDLIFSSAKNRQRVEIHVKSKGSGLVVQEEGAELMRVLGLAFDNLERKLKKDTEKFREKKRRAGRELAAEIPVEPPTGPAPEPARRIIPGKQISLKPMSVDEAALLLDGNKDDVLVFRKLGSERWAVLYRRRDGHYGLLEPEG
jgi:putative sigma-54 modulation protein